MTAEEQQEKIHHLREIITQRYEDFDRLMEERHAHLKLALDLQAKETERRLEALNHEAQRVGNIQATYVPREVFDNQFHALEAKVESLTAANNEQHGRQTVLTIVVAAAVSLLGAYVTHYFK